MNEIIKDTADELSETQDSLLNGEERIKSPEFVRNMHQKWKDDDAELSEGRAAIQELCDFVPPYDEEDLREKGMQDRFNVNYGLAASIINEAIGSYVDILMSADPIVKIALNDEVDPDQRSMWGDIMSLEFTKAIRSWDAMASNMMLLADIFVKQGVAIPMFEDMGTLLFDVYSLEDCKFDPKAVAIPSKNNMITIERPMSAVELAQKIDGHEDEEWAGNWNVRKVRQIIGNMKAGDSDDYLNYEEVARMVKSGRTDMASDIPSVTMIWAISLELNGKVSVYATEMTEDDDDDEPAGKSDEFVYRKYCGYDDVNKAYQIFQFSIGNKNRIYTIRGLGYAVYEAGMADNILRCKMMDAARHRASEIYHPESSIDSIEDITFIDLGHAMIAPRGLRGSEQYNRHRLEESIGYAISSNREIISRHSTGLAGSSLTENPTARRNEMQVTAELEHINKMSGFATTLFYPPLDKLTRELVRRAFTETQTDPVAADIVMRMKEACEKKGIPKEVFDQIDYGETKAVRLVGAGSKGSRIIGYQQMSQMFTEMDDIGKEFFNYDFASELQGSEKAARYFGIPGERRSHIDESIAQLENNDLLEGEFIDTVPGENKMVHLRKHVEALTDGIKAVNEGVVDMVDWTMRNIPLYSHCTKTLSETTVHESRIRELNAYRQMIQQAGELIDNGLRSINRMKRDGEMQASGQGGDGQAVDGQPDGSQASQPENPGAADHQLKMGRMFAEAQAKIEIMREMSKAKRAIDAQESMAKIAMMDSEVAAKIQRQTVLDRAGARE